MADALPILTGGPGSTPRITSLLIKPASAVCNLDCAYCFYLDRDADPYTAMPARRMTAETLERLVDTYLFYSYPHSTFAFQGGEPTLAGPAFFENVVRLQQRYGRNGQVVSNALQTNGILLDGRWCELFKQYQWLIGISIDGPESLHDLCRARQAGRRHVAQGHAGRRGPQEAQRRVHALCVVSQANVGKAAEIYRFFRSLGIDYIQYIPLSEFDGLASRFPTPSPPNNTAGSCARPSISGGRNGAGCASATSTTSARRCSGRSPAHAPCTKLATVTWWWSTTATSTHAISSWRRIGSWVTSSSIPGRKYARRQRRYQFAAIKTIAHPRLPGVRIPVHLPRRLSKHRHDPRRNFHDLDYFLRRVQDDFRQGSLARCARTCGS